MSSSVKSNYIDFSTVLNSESCNLHNRPQDVPDPTRIHFMKLQLRSPNMRMFTYGNPVVVYTCSLPGAGNLVNSIHLLFLHIFSVNITSLGSS